MLTIPEILRDHVTLDIECVDRVYLNGYIPTLQTSGSLVYFLQQHRGNPIASPVLLNNLTKAFGDRLILDNFSATILPGSIVGIVGPNGAGKTTLLKMITGQ